MPSMMRAAGDQSPLENIRPGMAKVQTSTKAAALTNDAATTTEMLSIIETARRRADLKLEYLAIEAGVKISTLSGALNGHGGFNVCWLGAWPPAFWNEFLPLLRVAKESTDDARRQQRKERLIQLVELLLTEVA